MTSPDLNWASGLDFFGVTIKSVLTTALVTKARDRE